MTVDGTELEWTYEPTDFFEAPYQHQGRDFELKVDNGRAIANLIVPTDPFARVRAFVENVLSISQLQLHRNYKLEGPRITQHSAGRKNVTLQVSSAFHSVTGGPVDFTVHDAAGNVIRDSKAERISEQTSVLNLLALKVQTSAILRSLLDSYSRSVADPDDEFVHLYEVRDALSRHYGGEQLARPALGISKSEWQRLGSLANAEPLEQGRHRGKHSQGRRQAIDQELDEACKLAREWIIAFARTL